MELKDMIIEHIQELEKQSKDKSIGMHERTMALVSKTEALKALVMLGIGNIDLGDNLFKPSANSVTQPGNQVAGNNPFSQKKQ